MAKFMETIRLIFLAFDISLDNYFLVKILI